MNHYQELKAKCEALECRDGVEILHYTQRYTKAFDEFMAEWDKLIGEGDIHRHDQALNVAVKMAEKFHELGFNDGFQLGLQKGLAIMSAVSLSDEANPEPSDLLGLVDEPK